MQKIGSPVACKIGFMKEKASKMLSLKSTLPALAPLCVLILISGCSAIRPVDPPWVAAVAGDGPGNPALLRVSDHTVENLPKSRRGNPREYSVFGQTYRVLDSAAGFKEQGVASWYGKKFHGRETSSGEIYDMHALTAAHKHIPLPTFVRVTRLDNGRSIVVKVNDRGPFVGDRIIDLSYAAAVQLDMVGTGKTAVSIEALSSHHPEQPALPPIAAVKQSYEQAPVSLVDGTLQPPLATLSDAQIYIQVGAFSEAPNAERMVDRILGVMVMPVAINHDPARQLHQVRIGPLQDGQLIQQTLNSLASAGIDGYTVVPSNP